MPLTPGTRLGPYVIEALLGAGGMGEVYRARDTKLGREVALKVLPETVEKDPERIARFEREAKSLAALNHPHIATLFGMERDASRHVLVMELVEGETLAEQIARGALPVAEALAIARQIAEALEAAHERGIVHRDLKPANVKVTPDGVVKVLDFGLAKALDSGPGSASNPSQSPTLSVMATEAGLILGTASYMSPEQAKGLPTDHRSDVFSFGGVLYELLTGRQPFPGDSVADVLAWVLAREPDWEALPALLDPRLTRLMRRCLAKSRRQRWQAIGDVRAEIEIIIAEPYAAPPSAVATLVPPRPLWKRGLPIAATAVVAGALAGLVGWNLKPPAAAPAVVRFLITMGSEPTLFTNFNRQILAVSRDGSQIAYAGEKLYLRDISEAAPQPIPGTEGFTSATHPAFSPDGRSVVFWAQTDRTLKRVTLGSTGIVTVCPLSEGGFGLTWAGDFIYFADAGKGILRVSANGGQAETIATIKGREELYGPQMLPDNDTLLFTLGARGMASWDQAQVVAQSMRTGARKILVERATGARYVSSGHLIFGRGGVIFAVPLDLKRLSIVGEPVAVVEGVRRAAPGTTGAVHFAVSDTGTLAYLPGPVTASGAAMQIAFFDRTGAAEALSVPLGPYNHPRVSPDGTRVAIGTDDGKEAQVWIYGFSKSSAARRLTFGGSNAFPVWSADGARVVFQSNREGDPGLWWQRADGTDKATRLTRAEAGASHVPQSWSPDGRHLLFDEVRGDRVSAWDYSVADGKAVPFSSLQSDVPSGATFSPDGRWVAYSIRLANPAQAVVYVEPYPPTGARYQISKESEDGHHAVWSPDGRELFYTPGPGNRFISVPITTTPAFSFGDAVLLPRIFMNAPPTAERTYDVARDGKRFLGLRTDVGSNGLPMSPQIQVVLNWFEELKRRVPVK
jgi:serine/threonine protein kinase/Tol biopolymer transport system component